MNMKEGKSSETILVHTTSESLFSLCKQVYEVFSLCKQEMHRSTSQLVTGITSSIFSRL